MNRKPVNKVPRKRKLPKLPPGMKARVWFAPMGSDPSDPKVWRLMGVVNALYVQPGAVYCLARIDPPFNPKEEAVSPEIGEDLESETESNE